ncbi:MAG: porin family protein [Gammaproteobacteria bacterium]|nr:porin family protein [Gammaproteobacteria bacterium]
MFKIKMILASILLSSSVYASGQVVIGLTPSVTWVTGNKTQTFDLQPGITKTYTASNTKNAFPSGELFLAWQKSLAAHTLNQSLISQLGISIVGTGNAKLSGDIWEDADPDFNNFTYNYKVKHAAVAIKGRLIDNTSLLLQPYISGSIGVGFNRAYGFSIQPKISEEVAAPPFHSNTTTTFTYTLGIGLQKSFNSHLQAAIGYEFADWGKTQLSRAAGQTVNQGLTLNHLYGNQLLFSLFYIV